MMITTVPTEYVHNEWAKVASLIQRATDFSPGRVSSSDIYILLLEGKCLLWVVYNDDEKIIAALTTRVLDVSKGRLCIVEWCGGDNMEEWIDDMLLKLEHYANDMSCTIIEAHGRLGWKRILEDHGWRQFSVSYDKVLRDKK